MLSFSATPVSREQIAEHARRMWEHAGCPMGKDVEIWFRAENELRLRHEHRDKTQALLARGGAERRPHY